MSEKRILLDTAAFMDSSVAKQLAGITAADIREITRRFLEACYDDAGKAPRLLDGEELATILSDLLPRHFGVRDRLMPMTGEVLRAYLEHIYETQIVLGIVELRRALEHGIDAFEKAVQEGSAHADGIRVTGKSKPIVHRAAKTGRNEPCPCGSGKKFKKCCGGQGGPYQ